MGSDRELDRETLKKLFEEFSKIIGDYLMMRKYVSSLIYFLDYKNLIGDYIRWMNNRDKEFTDELFQWMEDMVRRKREGRL